MKVMIKLCAESAATLYSCTGSGQPRRRAAEAPEVPQRHGLEDVGPEEVARQSLERRLFGLLRHGVQGERTLGCASALITRRRQLRKS